MAKGKSNKEIAEELGISIWTTKSYVHNLLVKLDCRNRTELAIEWFS